MFCHFLTCGRGLQVEFQLHYVLLNDIPCSSPGIPSFHSGVEEDVEDAPVTLEVRVTAD